MNSFFMLRLKNSFNDSMFEMSRKCVKIHSLIICSIPILLILTLLFYKSIIGFSILVLYGFIVQGGLLYLTYKFNHNLFILVVHQRNTLCSMMNMDKTTTDNDEKQNITLNSRQIVLLNTITRHSLLGVLSVGAQIIGLVFVYIVYLTGIGGEIAIRYLGIDALAIINILSTYMVHLGFASNTQSYNRLCSKSVNGLNYTVTFYLIS